MGLLDPERKRSRTRAAIHAALDKSWDGADELTLGASERMVIFSDQHKGARDGADDFQRCERTYNAALAYYDKLGYRLVELGDVEELWENRLKEVLAAYEHTLRLAARFTEGGRYTRIYGNHDIAWKDAGMFRDRLRRYGYGDVEPIEALRIVVRDDADRPVIELFLAHGHQGTASSDRFAFFSKLFVRFGWRWLQRLINRPWNTPSVDWALRGTHAKDMEEWAARERRVLIVGHTHMPVFFENSKPPPDPPADPGAADDRDAEALRLAREQWAAAEIVRLAHQPPIPLEKPCYFNTGCCSFGDGDITGLEIAAGEIRLIRWPCDAETAPDILGNPMSLADVESMVGTLA